MYKYTIILYDLDRNVNRPIKESGLVAGATYSKALQKVMDYYKGENMTQEIKLKLLTDFSAITYEEIKSNFSDADEISVL